MDLCRTGNFCERILRLDGSAGGIHDRRAGFLVLPLVHSNRNSSVGIGAKLMIVVAE